MSCWVGGVFAPIAIHAAVAGAPDTVVALAWRELWLTFLASTVPTIVFTVAGVLGMHAASLAAACVRVLGWLSAASHLVVLATPAQSGIFAPDSIVGALVPPTTVVWILSVCAVLVARGRSPVGTYSTRKPDCILPEK